MHPSTMHRFRTYTWYKDSRPSGARTSCGHHQNRHHRMNRGSRASREYHP
ncbi:Uncharacterised protein [Segatella copri]|nr:Uncharacterised protein [Segatella copri]